MRTEALQRQVGDPATLERTVERLREAGVALPTFAQLADPGADPGARPRARSRDVGPDEPHPLNLFRVHWYNDAEPHRRSSTSPSTSCCRAS